jgi:hypothetical protein
MQGALVPLGVAAYALACASGPALAGAPAAAQKGPAAEAPLPIPADLQPRIAESIEIGRELYLLDKASAIGTDVATAKVPDIDQRDLGGWLTMHQADDLGKPMNGFRVVFITKDEPFRMVFRIDVPLQGEAALKELTPPQPLDELGVRFFRARRTALEGVPRGWRNWNPVVLPGAALGRSNSILVYLLAAEQREGEIVFGIHYRVLVSADGRRIQAALPLSESALVIPPPQKVTRPEPGRSLRWCRRSLPIGRSRRTSSSACCTGASRSMWPRSAESGAWSETRSRSSATSRPGRNPLT